jgi:outer membrane protein OmpA-like peptidoglycan-associated protein
MMPDLAGAVSPELAERYGVSTGFIPYPGFRAGAGYEWKKWSFGLESGYTYIKGDNPLVTDIAIGPLLLKAGYSFFPISNYEYFSLAPTAAMGLVFAQVNHYKDAIDMLIENASRSENAGFIAQIGFRAGWNPVRQWDRFFEIFTGFSVDCVIETGGIIPLPQFELGIKIRPFAWKARNVSVPEEIVKEEILAIEEEIAEEAPESVRHIWSVLFPPNGLAPTAQGHAVLDEAGQVIAGVINETVNEKFRIILRGYAAPFVSVSGQMEVSRRRVLYCASYLKEKYEIPDELITVEWYGSQALPENTEEAAHSSRRSVEIIFEGRIQP